MEQVKQDVSGAMGPEAASRSAEVPASLGYASGGKSGGECSNPWKNRCAATRSFSNPWKK